MRSRELIPTGSVLREGDVDGRASVTKDYERDAVIKFRDLLVTGNALVFRQDRAHSILC